MKHLVEVKQVTLIPQDNFAYDTKSIANEVVTEAVYNQCIYVLDVLGLGQINFNPQKCTNTAEAITAMSKNLDDFFKAVKEQQKKIITQDKVIKMPERN